MKKLILILMATISIKANSKPQMEFLAASEYEVLFGGAAGGGKSYAMVIDPLRYIDVSKFTAIIFRRTFPELESSIIPAAKTIYYAAGATYHEQKKVFTFPSGATIRLGFMQHADDWSSYQGSPLCGQYFDELTNFLEVQYTQMGIWNRSECSVHPYRRASSNPGGQGHSWVKQRFIDTCPAQHDGEPRYSDLARMWWQPMKSGNTFWHKAPNGDWLTRKYIPSRVFDNEDLLQNNPHYLAQLLSLDKSRMKAYLEGDWDVFEGQFFSMWRRELHVVPPIRQEIPSGFAKAGVIDYGERTVLECGFRDFEGNITTFAECYTESMPPTDRFNAMADMLIERGLNNLDIYYDTNMDINLTNYVGYDKTQATIAREVFRDRMGANAPNLMVVSKSTTDRRGYRVVCNEAMRDFLSWKQNEKGEFIRKPRHYITEDCKHLINTLPLLLHDPNSPDGLDFVQTGGAIDDPYDADKMLLMALWRPETETQEEKPPETVAELLETMYTSPESDIKHSDLQ